MRKIFDQNRVAPVRIQRRKSWKLILLFFLLILTLFTLTFIISLNIIGGSFSSDKDLQAKYEEAQARIVQLEEKNAELLEEIKELQAQTGNTPVATQPPTTTTKPSTATAKPTTKPAAATTKPTTKPAAATTKPTSAPDPTAAPNPTSPVDTDTDDEN